MARSGYWVHVELEGVEQFGFVKYAVLLLQKCNLWKNDNKPRISA